MALPTSYLTSVKNLEGILAAIQGAQAPEKFTQSFLEALEFKSSSDRLFINVLKALGFLDQENRPTDRYYRYLDQTQAPSVMAEALQDAYRDLYQVNTKAQDMTKNEVINKMRTLTQGAHKDGVLEKMAMTFLNLAKHADFSSNPKIQRAPAEDQSNESLGAREEERRSNSSSAGPKPRLGELRYSINIVLPATRDTKIYDAIFKSLREHIDV